MEPVSNIGQLLETLRKRLSETQQKTSPARAAATSKAGGAARPSVAELQRKVREKLRHIGADDPKARQKSMHVFLESVLLWEFGEGLMKDLKFYALLDEVQNDMASDAEVKDKLSMLVDQLRKH